MKTYNLVRTSLYRRRGDEDCFCALGIYAEEKMGAGTAQRLEYNVFRDEAHREALDAMANFLAPLINEEFLPEHEENYAVVYRANDRSTRDPNDQERFTPTVPVEKIKEALALAGIEVELNDLREKEYVDAG